METFRAIFDDIPDTRYKNAQYDLTEIIFIALTAVLCGAESCTDIADYGRDKEEFLRECLDLKHGIPSHDTFSRVFRFMDPEAFEKAFRKFIAEFAKALPKGVVAIDGKSIKSAFHSGQQHMPPMMISAWAADMRLVLSQLKVENGNETEAAIRLVGLLDIEGATVTADALHCNRGFAQAVIDRGADYVLALKENQSRLFARAEQDFADSEELETASTKEKSHGRQEVRTGSVIVDANLETAFDFPGLTAIGRIESNRDGATAIRYYALSKPLKPGELLSAVRSHWTIENQLHWVLDVAMLEDSSRSRNDHAPENIAMIRKLALNILQNDPEKISVRRKIKKAGWNNDYLKKLLFNMQ